MKQKYLFQIILALGAITLVVLPFFVSFNNLLTQMVVRNRWYMWIDKTVVPLEARMVGVMVKPLGIDVSVGKNLIVVNGRRARVTWNCLGWQSLILFAITLIVGLKDAAYTRRSKIETIVIGSLSLYLVNLLRMVFTVILLAFARPIFKIVFHDYLAAFVTILFLLCFWWFVYRFILEEK